MSAEQTTEIVPDDDGPECETCGKTTCPDADLPGFSEPVRCLYAPIYHALKDSKDCDYGCARDYTNQAVRLWVVQAVEEIVVAARVDERDLRLDNADLARQLSDACARRADAFDEGYDKAMQDAHYVLNRMGYLERRGEDNCNPYRSDERDIPPGSPAQTDGGAA